ncbi:MAG: hypothetical protein PHY26_01355 [Bacilli bacterium]|nr:hypothetical protein [Bacilli bacterium]
MKKIILSLVLFFCTFNVYANDNHNEPFWQIEKISDEKYELIKTERRYRWYLEEYVYSDEYYLKGLNSSSYPYLNQDDYIETEWSNWDHKNNPTIHPDRLIEKRTVNKYRELKPIRYIIFDDFKGGFLSFNVSELNIFIDNKLYDYEMECFNCSNNFYHYVTNGVINENNAYVNNGGKIIIDLGDYYSINKIKIELYMYDHTTSPKKFNLYMTETPDITNNIYYQFVSYVVSSSYLNPERYLIIPDQDWIINPVYQDWVYTDDFLNATYYRQMIMAVEKRYKDIKYRYFNINKDYLDGFYLEVNGDYIKDEENYQDYYLYRLIELNLEEEIKPKEPDLVESLELEIKTDSKLKKNIKKETKTETIINEEETGVCPVNFEDQKTDNNNDFNNVLPKEEINNNSKKVKLISTKSKINPLSKWLLIIIVVVIIIKIIYKYRKG